MGLAVFRSRRPVQFQPWAVAHVKTSYSGSSQVLFCFTSIPAEFRQLTALTASQEAPPKVGLSAYRFAAATSSPQTRQPSPRSDHTSARLPVAKSVKAISPHLSNNPYSALITVHESFSPGHTLLPEISHKTSALAEPANPNHTYWCTVCRNRSYKNSDDWKKHEKEHETKYICMLNGLFEITEDGQKCVLCGALNPADSHHLAHSIAPCLEAEDRPSFKRRYDMVAHLKDAHDIPNGGIIADKWLHKSFKKAWSCGFCIQLFPSLKDRLKHIGTEHFKKGQSINDWDFTKVIQGLLLQPGIQESWQHLLDTLDPFRLSEIKWNKFGREDIQQRLEKGLTSKETAQSLAIAAYDNAEYDWTLADIGDIAFATTMNSVPDPYINKVSSPFLQEHAVASEEEARVQCQPWSPPQHQASQIPTTSPTSRVESAYVTAASISPPARLVPPLDHEPVWKPLASNTTDMNTTRPRTSSNEKFGPPTQSVSTSWGGDPTHSDLETFRYKSNDDIAWSTIPHPDIDCRSSTLKRPRDSVSPQAQTCKSSLENRPRKKR